MDHNKVEDSRVIVHVQRPSAVQQRTIISIFQGRNVIAQGPTWYWQNRHFCYSRSSATGYEHQVQPSFDLDKHIGSYMHVG